MVNKALLIDTNAYSRLMLGDKRVFNQILASQITYMSTIVLAELMYGFRNGKRYETNMEYLNQFVGKPGVRVVGVSLETAVQYAEVKTGLKKLGRPIPENDIWIAAQAMEHTAQLLTFDKHFKNVTGLDLIYFI